MFLKRRWRNKIFPFLLATQNVDLIWPNGSRVSSPVFYNDYKKYKKQNIHNFTS